MPKQKPVDLDALQNVERVRRELWDRLPGESQRAFFAFQKYRDAEGRRSLSAVAAALWCSKQNIQRWAFQWQWEERTTAFDIHQDQVQRNEMAKARTEMNRRHIRIGMMMQSIGAHALAELQQKVELKQPLGLSPDEAKALLDAGAKLERAAHGPERAGGRYTEIRVNFTRLEDDSEEEDDRELVEGKPPKVN